MRRFLHICIVAAALTAAAAGLWADSPGLASSAYGVPLIRFHVIANSDSPADQALKLKVRDAVIGTMTPALTGVQDIDEARARVDASLDLIKTAAQKVLAENGCRDTIRVTRGICEFPEKTYRIRSAGEGGTLDLTLPAGDYEAVRVVIGSGRGGNWWCVMFPPLCFVNPGDPGLPAGNAGVREKDDGEIPAFRYDAAGPEKAATGTDVEYRLKVLEWYEKFRDWELGIRN